LNTTVGVVWLICLAACQTETRIPPPTIAPVPDWGEFSPAHGKPSTTPATTDSLHPSVPSSSTTVPNPPLRIAPQQLKNSAEPGSDPSGSWRPASENTGRSAGVHPASPADAFTGNVATADIQGQRLRTERIFRRLLQTQPSADPALRLFVVPQAEPLLRCQPPNQVIVSVGLLRQCASDGQLAGILSLPLATLLQRSESQSAALDRPPPDLPIGPESSTYGELPPWRQAELVKTGHARREPLHPRHSDPVLLARQMVLRAGYSAQEFESGGVLAGRAGFRPN